MRVSVPYEESRVVRIRCIVTYWAETNRHNRLKMRNENLFRVERENNRMIIIFRSQYLSLIVLIVLNKALTRTALGNIYPQDIQ